MREIKFRGKKASTGEIIYGGLSFHNGQPFIDDFRVESYQQFCGCDSNGDEVYEGDIVIARDKEYTVRLVPKYGLFYDLKFARKK